MSAARDMAQQVLAAQIQYTAPNTATSVCWSSAMRFYLLRTLCFCLWYHFCKFIGVSHHACQQTSIRRDSLSSMLLMRVNKVIILQQNAVNARYCHCCCICICSFNRMPFNHCPTLSGCKNMARVNNWNYKFKWSPPPPSTTYVLVFENAQSDRHCQSDSLGVFVCVWTCVQWMTVRLWQVTNTFRLFVH